MQSPTKMIPPGWLVHGAGKKSVCVTTMPPAYSVPSGPNAATASAQLDIGTSAGCHVIPASLDVRPPHEFGIGVMSVVGYRKLFQSTKRLAGSRGFSAISGSPIVVLPFAPT